MKPEDIAMDFFRKLDNGRYAGFKTTFINGLQMQSVKPPKDLNEIFTLAKTYLKPELVTGSGGMGSTFATTTDTIEIKPGEGKGQRQRGKNPQGQGKEDKSNSDSSDKVDRSVKKKLKCFSCGGDHCINNCPKFLEFKKMKEEESRQRQPGTQLPL
jgi:ribosomal protein L44E